MKNRTQHCRKPGGGPIATLLWLVALAVLILRATYTESPDIHTNQPGQYLSNPGFSLLLSSCLLGIFGIWFFGIGRRIWPRQRTGIEAGVFLLICGGLAAAAWASDKRLAINDLITLTSPMLCGIALVYLLDSGWKIRVTLLVVCGLGVLNTFQCVSQLMESNASMIETYELDPDATLSKLGVEPGSLQQMLFEHRLYSKDINAFFTTSNSAATFLLMSFFSCLALIADAFRRDSAVRAGGRVLLLLTAGVLLAGIIITRSKGGILALIAAGLGLGLVIAFGRSLHRYRWAVLVLVLIAGTAAAGVAIQYGTRHGKLPGGNSMLVRWQYWETSARIIADCPLGVGPGNYYLHYTTYKDPGAVEEVRDPHNFILSLACEYGPAGLLGFLAGAGIPIGLWIFGNRNKKEPFFAHEAADRVTRGGAVLSWLIVCGALALLLLVRPILFPMETTKQYEVNAAAFSLLYVIPALILGAALFLLFRSEPKWVYREDFLARGSLLCILFGIAAVSIHNLIDYAIFEPGNLTLFWILVAVFIRLAFSPRFELSAPAAPSAGGVLAAVITWSGCSLTGLFLAGVLWLGTIPAVHCGRLVQKAFQHFPDAQMYLTRAIEADPLSARPAFLLGSFFEQQAAQKPDQRLIHLKQALEAVSLAAKRNPENHRNYGSLAAICIGLAASDDQHPGEYWYREALNYLQTAIAKYPGADRYHYQAGQLAEQLDMPEAALDFYKTAVAIEDAFRKQFREMYPDRELFSRMGVGRYLHAKERIDILRQR